MKPSKILLITGGIVGALYLSVLLCTRDFYYINNVPITIYNETVILGRFYCGFTHPATDYIILDTHSVDEELYFYNEKEFDLFTASHPKMSLHKFSCKSICHLGETSIDEFEKSHPKEDAYISMNMYWDWGHFWPLIYYKTKDGKLKCLHHRGFFRWDFQ